MKGSHTASLNYWINMGCAAFALSYITGRPAYSFLLLFLPAAIVNSITYLICKARGD